MNWKHWPHWIHQDPMKELSSSIQPSLVYSITEIKSWTLPPSSQSIQLHSFLKNLCKAVLLTHSQALKVSLVLSLSTNWQISRHMRTLIQYLILIELRGFPFLRYLKASFRLGQRGYSMFILVLNLCLRDPRLQFDRAYWVMAYSKYLARYDEHWNLTKVVMIDPRVSIHISIQFPLISTDPWPNIRPSVSLGLEELHLIDLSLQRSFLQLQFLIWHPCLTRHQGTCGAHP